MHVFYKILVLIMSLGLPEILGIFAIIVLLFGSKRLPELGSGVGQAIANFKKSFKDAQAIDVTPKEENKSEKKEDKSI